MWSIIRDYRAVLDWNSWRFTDVCRVFGRCLAASFWTSGVCVWYDELGQPVVPYPLLIYLRGHIPEDSWRLPVAYLLTRPYPRGQLKITRCLFTYEAISQRTAEDYPLLIYLRDHIPEDSWRLPVAYLLTRPYPRGQLKITRCLFTYEAISQRTAEDYSLLIYLRDHIPEESWRLLVAYLLTRSYPRGQLKITRCLITYETISQRTAEDYRCLFTYEAISQRTAEDYPLLIYLRGHIPEDSWA